MGRGKAHLEREVGAAVTNVQHSADCVGSGCFDLLGLVPIQADMSTSFASKLSKGHSLLGSLANSSLGLLRTSHDEIAKLGCSSFLSQLQQQRTFIQMRTNLKVVDNSGAKRVMCIQALKQKKGARLGDTIIASVKEAQPRGKVKKGEVVYGVVVRAAMQRGRCDGSEINTFRSAEFMCLNGKCFDGNGSVFVPQTTGFL
ncbi:hypothetical protein MRB53_020522 [Persea americana]|uniref:Uncharacterized protein n=1 Tax=Persea americana TaxID=3435 RepID=A0ACC2L1S9_PERAE|nr:hypothetical protein MRB53_020522 [Persea americana]